LPSGVTRGVEIVMIFKAAAEPEAARLFLDSPLKLVFEILEAVATNPVVPVFGAIAFLKVAIPF
jgi:hypothetical protein